MENSSNADPERKQVGNQLSEDPEMYVLRLPWLEKGSME